MNASGVSYSGETEIESQSDAAPKYLNPFAASIVGMWYSLTFASALAAGAKFVVLGSESHYFIDSCAWVLGAILGAALATSLADTAPLLIAGVSTFPAIGAFFVVEKLLGGQELDPLAFGYRPSVFAFSVTFMILTFLSGLAVGWVRSGNVAPDDLGTEVGLSMRPIHWFWLWIAAWAWTSMLPVAIYYLWLQLVTTGYSLVHPRLWFDFTWDKDVVFGFAPGFAGIATLFYGVGMSLDAVTNQVAQPSSTKRRIFKFLLGTVVLVSVVSGFLLNWGISNLKSMPLPKDTNPWWIL